MESTLFLTFAESLRSQPREEGSRQLSIEPIDFNTFKAKTHKDGKISLRDIVDLYDWAKSTIAKSAYQLNFFYEYHHDSPNFWMKDVLSQEPNEEGFYNVMIDLEDFLESEEKEKQMVEKTPEWFIPDNYSLAKKVLKEFEELHLGHELLDHSFRDCACWKSKNYTSVVALAKYIQEKYVAPKVFDMMKDGNIKECEFPIIEGKQKINFIYDEERVESNPSEK